MLLTLTLAAVAVLVAAPEWVVGHVGLVKDGELTYDLNADGEIDHVEIWRRGDLLEIRQDSNADGRLDSFSYFRDDEVIRLELDLDHDGQVDYRASTGADGREQFEVLRDGVMAPMVPGEKVRDLGPGKPQ